MDHRDIAAFFAKQRQLWRRRQLVFTGVGLCGWLAVSLGPSTVGLGFMKKQMCTLLNLVSYTEDLKPKTQTLVDEVVADMNTSRQRHVKTEKIEFLQTGYLWPELLHKGSTGTYAGAFIALPCSFSVKTLKEFLFEKPILSEAELKDMKRKADFCLLSDKANKFVLARELLYVEDSILYSRCVFGLLSISLFSTLFYFTNRYIYEVFWQRALAHLDLLDVWKGQAKTMAEKTPRLVRVLAQCRILCLVLLGISSLNLYWALLYSKEKKLEIKADETVASLGRDYVEGGLEYYNKLIGSNQYRKEVLGEKKFYSNGNIVGGYLLNKTNQLMGRRDYFENRVKTLNENTV